PTRSTLFPYTTLFRSSREVAFPIRVFARMGIRAVVLTNAAGGINLDYQQGALVVISDHINLQGQNPLIGQNDDRFGTRYPDLTQDRKSTRLNSSHVKI